MVKSFMTGLVVGGAVMWVWGDQIRDYLDQATGDARARAADRLQDAADTLHSVADTVEPGVSGAPGSRSR